MIQCGYGYVPYKTAVYFPVSFKSYARVIPCAVNDGGYVFDNIYNVQINYFVVGVRTAQGGNYNVNIMWIACGF